MLDVIDEVTREALAIEVDRSIDADAVVVVLSPLAILGGGAPAFLRFNNGPEFIANAAVDWCRFHGCESMFIDQSTRWQNAWIKGFNGRFRDELLNLWQFGSLLEARGIIKDWRIDHNVNRPRTAHGKLSPAEFAAHWTTINQPEAT